MNAVLRLAPLVLAFAPLLGACGQAEQKQAAPPPPAVTVAKPVKQTVTDYDEYVGRFVAVDMVEVRARVSGYLDKVHFTDGQIVKQGDLLFTIDRRPFEATIAQARANLAQARANLAFATSDLARASQLVRDRTITEQTFDQRTQAKSVAEASVAAQEAAVRQAELDLQFTELKAPVSGRTGDRRVSEGNLVTGGTGGSTTLLATIVSTDPIRFEFTFDESSYLRYERLGIDVKDSSKPNSGIEVSIKLIDEPELEPAFVALMLTVPGEAEIAREIGQDVDPDAIFAARSALRERVGLTLMDRLSRIYRALTENGPYQPDAASVGRRALRNASLDLMVASGSPDAAALARAQYRGADNMTDRMAALSTISLHNAPARLVMFQRVLPFQLCQMALATEPTALTTVLSPVTTWPRFPSTALRVRASAPRSWGKAFHRPMAIWLMPAPTPWRTWAASRMDRRAALT